MSTNKRTVLYVSHESELNGAPRSLIEMLDCLKNYVTPIVILPRKGSLEELLIQNNIKYYIVPFLNGHGDIGHHTQRDSDIVYADNITAAHTIVKIVKENNIQLIHSNSSVVDVGAIAAVLSNKPHLWHLREFCEEDFGFEYLNKEWKKMLFSTSNFFSISQSIKDAYHKKYFLKSDAAIDFINANTIKQNNSSFTQDIVRLIIAGYISKGKGQIDAVRAINILVRKNIHNIRLIIVGNGAQSYIWSINKYMEYWGLQEYVKILPFSNNIDDIRKKCDISLTCSKMEGLGRVTMEAMLAGITVIGTDTGGTKELIGHNQERGYLYKQGDFSDLADKIEFVVKDSYQRKLKIMKADYYIREIVDSESYAKKILDAYENCIDSHSEKCINQESVKGYINANKIIDETANDSHNIETSDFSQNKFKSMFYMAEKWIRIHHNSNTIGDFIRQYGYRSIAIYGFGYLGRRLYDELSREHIKISYLIDNADFFAYELFTFLKPNDHLPPVDLIIITVSVGYEKITEMLTAKYPYHVISLSNILDEMLLDNI